MKQNNLELKSLIIIFKNEKNINIVFLLNNNKNIIKNEKNINIVFLLNNNKNIKIIKFI